MTSLKFSRKRIGQLMGLIVLGLVLAVGSGMAGSGQQPKVEFITPADRAVLWETVRLAVRASGFVEKDGNVQGKAEFEYSLDGLTYWPLLVVDKAQGQVFSINWDSETIYDDRYFLRVTVTDQAGNRGSAQIIVTLSNEFLHDQLVVRFTKETSLEAAKAVAGRVGAQVLQAREYKNMERTYYTLKIIQDRSVRETLRLLAAEPGVEHGEPSYIIKTTSHQTYPSDLKAEQWGLLNAGQNGGVIDADIDIPQAWTLHQDCVGVAIIDTGVHRAHEDLRGGHITWLDGLNFMDTPIEDRGNPRDLSTSGHGTFVAGIIAADGNNGNSVAGICWRAKLMSLGFYRKHELPDPSDPSRRTIREVGLALFGAWMITHAAENREVRVINLSVGSANSSEEEETALSEAARIRAVMGSTGLLIVAAAGNDGALLQKGDPLYISDDDTVNEGDIRLHNVTVRNPDGTLRTSLLPGRVQRGDEDVGWKTLQPLPPGVRYYDSTSPTGYNEGDDIYQDADKIGAPGYGKVSAGDTLLRGSGARKVLSEDPPGQPLELKDFPDKTKYLDQGSPGYGADSIYPCMYSSSVPSIVEVICVAASNRSDQLWGGSNYGSDTVDLAAPGEDITSLRRDGGVLVASGTSAAVPYVTGVAALCWSMLPHLSAAQIKGLILKGVDQKPAFKGTTRSGGRLRWPCNRDSGDAPDSRYLTKWNSQGPLHLDNGNEWLELGPNRWHQRGFKDGVSSEYDETDPARDPDRRANLQPVNTDQYDDGIKLIPPPPWKKGQEVQVYVGVCSDYAGTDRYGGDRKLYLNAWFDWDRNGEFHPRNEHVIKSYEVTPDAALRRDASYPPAVTCWSKLPPKIRVPNDIEEPIWLRFRLDYVEDSGKNDPWPHFARARWNSDAAVGLNAWETGPTPSPHGAVQFGEVEDYISKDSSLIGGPVDLDPRIFWPWEHTPVCKKDRDKSHAKPGETVVYTITCTNRNVAFGIVKLTDHLPSQVTFQSLNAPDPRIQYSASTRTVEGLWTLQGGQTSHVRITTTINTGIPPGTTIINPVTVDFGTPTPLRFESPPTVVTAPSVTIPVTVPVGPGGSCKAKTPFLGSIQISEIWATVTNCKTNQPLPQGTPVTFTVNLKPGKEKAEHISDIESITVSAPGFKPKEVKGPFSALRISIPGPIPITIQIIALGTVCLEPQ